MKMRTANRGTSLAAGLGLWETVTGRRPFLQGFTLIELLVVIAIGQRVAQFTRGEIMDVHPAH